MSEKGKLFPTTKFQLINFEDIIRQKIRYVANTTLIIVLVKTNQQMLKFMDKSMMRHRIFISSSRISSQDNY